MTMTTLGSFDGLEYGDEIEYTGPGDLPANWAVPKDWKQPYTFCFVTFGGSLACETRHGSPKCLAPEHPANDPGKWRHVGAEEVDR